MYDGPSLGSAYVVVVSAEWTFTGQWDICINCLKDGGFLSLCVFNKVSVVDAMDVCVGQGEPT